MWRKRLSYALPASFINNCRAALEHASVLEVTAKLCRSRRCFRGNYRVMLGHVGALEVAAKLCWAMSAL
jgi:hypothetical protein